MTARADRLWQRAERYLNENQIAAARVTLESLAQEAPQNVDVHLILGGIAWEEDRVRDAIRHALDAARMLPDDERLVTDVVAALLQAGETVAARNALAHPSLARSRDIETLVRAGGFRYKLAEHADALALLDRAKSAGADGADFRFSRAMQLVFNGRLREAESELEACLRLPQAPARATLELARLRKQTPERNHLEDLARRLKSVAPDTEEAAAIEFARYKELEDLGRYDEAWDALAHANAIMYARHSHDPAASRRLFGRLTTVCTPEFLKPADVVHDGPQPIFIIGMPRSGTTVVDRLLGNHPKISMAGELDDFALQMRWAADHRSTLDETVLDRLAVIDYANLGRRYLDQTQWRAHGKPYFTDKLPRNWMVAGPIAKSLPQAKIVHLVRDPMDVCFSNFRVMFADAFAHIYDLDALASHYLEYRRVLDHWHAAMPGRVLDVVYADLVNDPETTMRAVLAHCGLEWDPACVDLTKNESAVATLSTAQVREPIHARAIKEWMRYEKQLEPLRRALSA
ncbi:MAG TPA: sulfotransferase [Rhodanobacteraceae bacterium]|nr:sulfotransferase [Rhodanobacteraceae bacterium]